MFALLLCATHCCCTQLNYLLRWPRHCASRGIQACLQKSMQLHQGQPGMSAEIGVHILPLPAHSLSSLAVGDVVMPCGAISAPQYASDAWFW